VFQKIVWRYASCYSRVFGFVYAMNISRQRWSFLCNHFSFLDC